MKKIVNVIFSMVIPTMFAFGAFFFIFSKSRQQVNEYRWVTIIPLAIVTVYIVIENKKEWMKIKEQR